ncbi:hypothetical protein FOZ63_013958 [Perkinsus olseni]|uniref:Uncharacterized protein n=1 Tax=Perkinsus olseni TaxID=32597 RepID=A0A7J6TD12_PEROL|nr:hypothetical protein FOZ63_013958 [Perkinsus olseni]
MRYSPPSQDDRHWRRIIRKSTKMRDACVTGRRRTSVASRRSSISSTFTDVPPPVEESGNFNPVSLAELQQVCEELGKPIVAIPSPPTRRQASVLSRHARLYSTECPTPPTNATQVDSTPKYTTEAITKPSIRYSLFVMRMRNSIGGVFGGWVVEYYALFSSTLLHFLMSASARPLKLSGRDSTRVLQALAAEGDTTPFRTLIT